MSNGENEVRELLNRKADEATSTTRIEMPPAVRVRIRRRQVRTGVLSGLIVVTLVSTVFGLSRAWQSTPEPPELRFATDPRSGSSNLPAPVDTGVSGWAELARGTIDGKPWSLVTYKSNQGWCIEIQVDKGSGGACGLELPVPDLSVGVNTHEGYPTFINGAVSERVDGVRLELESGEVVEGNVYAPPDSLGAPFDVFLILTEPDAVGSVIALDASGKELAREPLLPLPPVPPPPRMEVHDAYENLVGFVPLTPPPPQGEELRCSPEFAPGTAASRENIDLIRAFACADLQDVTTQVEGFWWLQRPGIDASDEAFLDWWGAYPLHEKVLQTVDGEDVYASYDAHGNIWAYLPAGEGDHTIFRATPGRHDARVGRIRNTAGTRMVAVQELALDWWESRPKPEARDDAFLDWWSAYPVTVKLPGA